MTAMFSQCKVAREVHIFVCVKKQTQTHTKLKITNIMTYHLIRDEFQEHVYTYTFDKPKNNRIGVIVKR